MERPTILAHLAMRQPGRAWVAEDARRKIVGFALGREGRIATSLGPVVADNEAIALALIAKAASSAPGPFIIDVPDAHRAGGLARSAGRGDAARLHADDPGRPRKDSTIRATSLLSPAPSWGRIT